MRKQIMITVAVWSGVAFLELGWTLGNANRMPITTQQQLSPAAARLERLIQEAHYLRIAKLKEQ